jgi:hypothetical protein
MNCAFGLRRYFHSRFNTINNQASIHKEHSMAKGQQKSNKEGKKPKKDTSPAKVLTGEPVRAAIVTAVMPKGKEKNKGK